MTFGYALAQESAPDSIRKRDADCECAVNIWDAFLLDVYIHHVEMDLECGDSNGCVAVSRRVQL